MADYIVKDTELTSVANAIRTAGGTNSLLSFPNGFVSAVGNISGDGGSSDFSTAEVTISGIGEGAYVPMDGCYCFDYDSEGLIIPFHEISDGIYLVPLYKGAVVFTPDVDLIYTLSGNATENGGIFITGDCTITIS